jgi:hypothetical protein
MKTRCTRDIRRRGFDAAILVALLAAGGCGNLTPGGIGEATVVVTGDQPFPAPSGARESFDASVLPSSHDDDIDEADEAEGEVEVEFLVSLVTEAGSEVRLGSDRLRVRVDLQGEQRADVVTQMIPALRYTRLRLIFTEIEAEVEAGLVINGVPVIGEIDVELDDVSLLVTRPIDIDVGDGESVQLVVDLNAPAWLTAVDPLTLLVDETVFAGLINVITP